MPYIKFLSVRSDICRQLPSDSTSRWTPLPLTMQFPLLGLARDFHPLDNVHAERTKKEPLPTLAMALNCPKAAIISSQQMKTYNFTSTN